MCVWELLCEGSPQEKKIEGEEKSKEKVELDSKEKEHLIPCSRGGSSLWARNENELFLFFGFSPSSPHGPELDDVWKFDVEEKKWSLVERDHSLKWPQGRSVFGLASLGEACVIFGGEISPSTKGHEGAGSFSQDLWLFDGENWTELQQKGEKTPSARGWHEMCFFGEGKILLVGGLNETNDRLFDAYILEIEK